VNNIPKKKNNRKPVSRKNPSSKKETFDNAELQRAIVQALMGDEKEENNIPKEVKLKSYSPIADRSKMWQQEQPKETISSSINKRSRKSKTVEDKWSSSRNKTTEVVDNKPLWIASILLVLLLICGGSFAFKLFLSNNDQNSTSGQTSIESVSKAALANKVEVISEALNNYLTATSIDEKCKNIYKAEEFKSEIEAYYQKNELKVLEDFEISKVQPVLFDRKEYWEVIVVDKNKKQLLYYIRTDENELVKVDWKADVVFQKNDIQSFIESRSTNPHIFRVYFDSSVIHPVYAWGFTEEEYMFVSLNIPNTENHLWGYIKRDSEISDTLERLQKDTSDFKIRSKDGLKKFLIEMRFMEDSDAENNQAVMIDRIISNSWVNTEE